VGEHQKWFCHQTQGVSITERSQPNGGKTKMSDHKLRSGVNWQWALKRKGVK
jgi:hypothetical protein